MKILYIPFSFDDALFDLEFKVRKWLQNYESKGKEAVAVYHGSNSAVIQERVQQALQEGDCQIYILSHGINTAELIVSNQAIQDDTYKEMSIQEVAENFEKDLLNPETCGNNIVKLYFCDEDGVANKSRIMAEQFRTRLSEPYQTLEVKYYTDVCVGPPAGVAEGSLGFKSAMRLLYVDNDLFHLSLSCLVGKASSFRHGLNEPERADEPRFFKRAPKMIKYPQFSQPLLKQLAEELVELVQSDKICAQNQDDLIAELIQILPRDLDSYLVDSLTIIGKQLKFELQINLPRLEKLIKSGISSSVSNPESNPEIASPFF